MFRAIDPDGLAEVADLLARWGDRIRHEALLANAVLTRCAGIDVAGALVPIERWATETAADLRWRADTIRLGQRGGLSLPALLHAEFAATGVFTPGAQDAAFVTWLRDRVVSRETVTVAIASIGLWLRQGLLDWDVTNEDLHNIKTTLESLTGSELDQVIVALSPRQLQRWLAEMGHSLNGFSQAEKREVFELLAKNSSGDTLRLVHDALLASGGRTDLLSFGAAIQAHSPDTVAADFVVAVLAGDLAGSQFSSLAPAGAIQGLQDEIATTRATAAILEHPSALPWFIADAVAAGESPDEFIAALTGTTEVDHLAAGFVGALALLAAPGELAEMISARRSGTRAHSGRATYPLLEETQEQLLSASVRLLSSAPEAVFTHLAKVADPNGDLTTAFWHLLVNRGDTEAIAVTLQRLRGGPEVDLDVFSSRGTEPDYQYPYARNLAFAAATLNRGFTQSAQDAHGDIDGIARVAGVATAVTGLYSGAAAVAEMVTGTGAEWTIDRHASNTKADIDTQLAHLIDAATSRLRPPDDADLAPFPGAGDALLAWTSVYTRLLPHA